jgi:protein O-mannosyl-transferase
MTIPTLAAQTSRRSAAVTWSLASALAVITFLVFAPALWNGFVDWDDNTNLTKNLSFRGFSAANVRWILTTTLMGHYIPVTWTTFALDYTLWGMNPFGYHLTNLVLHTENVLLFFAVASRLIARASAWPAATVRTAAAFAALFFAVHPLRAESVAWVTERRDVLSGLFFLVSVLGYLIAQERTGRARRLHLTLSLAAFALALLSKAIVMSLPLVLVILDVYPLRRFTPTWRGLRAAHPVLLEKLPYALLAVAGAAVSYYAVHVNSFVTPLTMYPWPARVAMAFYSFWQYVALTALPVGLSPMYELPAALSPLELRFALPALGVLSLTAVALALRRRCPALLAVWAFYVVVLGPVSGIVHSGFQLAHDRYSYLSCLGLALLAGSAVAALVVAQRAGRVRPAIARLGVGLTGAWLVMLSVMTWHQVQVWRDTQTLWTQAVDADPACAVCHSNLGIFLGNHGNVAAGIAHVERALALRPDWVRVHVNLGTLLLQANRRTDAMAHFEKAIAEEPNNAEALSAMAVALIGDKRPAEAIRYLGRALEADPTNALVRTNRAAALAHLGLRTEALDEYRRAIAIDPTSAPAHYGLGWALVRFGDRDAARAQVEVLRGLDPFLATTLVAKIEARR